MRRNFAAAPDLTNAVTLGFVIRQPIEQLVLFSETHICNLSQYTVRSEPVLQYANEI